MADYIFTPETDRDLEKIILWTRSQWGEKQLKRYLTALEKGISDLIEGRIRYREFSGFYYPLRRAHIGHHYVFLFIRGDSPPW